MLLPPVLLLFLFIAPSFAAPLPAEGLNNIVIRGPWQSNELVSRKIHVHLPKVHLPHVDGSKILDGLKKWAPKIGKTIFKIATKLILREEGVEARSLSDDVELDLTNRDIIGDGVDARILHDLIARSPKRGLKKLLKAVKKVKKYAKKNAKKYAKAELKAVADTTLDIADDSLGERDGSSSVDRDMDSLSRDEGDWEYGFIVKELEGLDVDVWELELYLDALVGGLEHLIRNAEDGNDSEIRGHWLDVEAYMAENGVWH